MQEFNDRYTQAHTYHQLGILAQMEQDLVEAKRNYCEAFTIFHESNDPYHQAGASYQLGLVAEGAVEKARQQVYETIINIEK